jgi:hypothetical protein
MELEDITLSTKRQIQKDNDCSSVSYIETKKEKRPESRGGRTGTREGQGCVDGRDLRKHHTGPIHLYSTCKVHISACYLSLDGVRRLCNRTE